MQGDDESARRHGRRDFVAAVGSIAAVAGLPAAAPAAAEDRDTTPRAEGHPAGPVVTTREHQGRQSHQDVAGAPDGPTRLFLGAVTPGTVLGDFTVIAVHAPFRGAVPIVLEGAGVQVQLDVLAAGGGPAPLAEGAGLAVYGSFPAAVDPRQVGRAAGMALALLAPQGDARGPLGLLTFEARGERHPYAVYSVTRD